MSALIFWLALGAVLLIAETFFIPGVGLFFGGVGAIITSIIMHYGYADSTLLQLISFFGTSTLCGILLWKPFKKLHSKK